MVLVSCSTVPKIHGYFYSDALDYMVIKRKHPTVESNLVYDPSINFQRQYGRRLNFKSSYYVFLLFRFLPHADKYKFRIDKVNSSGYIVVSPVSKLAKEMFCRDSILFRPRWQIVDPTIHLEKIVYHSGMCFGTCADFSLEVDSLGNFHCTIRGNAYDTIPISNNFYGKMSALEFGKLLRILSYSQLKMLAWAPTDCCDAPMKNLIIYFNKRRLQLNTMFYPAMSEDLIAFLDSLIGNKSIRGTNQTYVYENYP